MILLASWTPSINSLQKPVEFQSLVLNDLLLEMVPGSLWTRQPEAWWGPVTTQLLQTEHLCNRVQASQSALGRWVSMSAESGASGSPGQGCVLGDAGEPRELQPLCGLQTGNV